MAFAPIRTERLILRRPVLADAEAAYERRRLPEVARYQDWEMPYERERAERSTAAAAAMDGPVDGQWWSITVVDASTPEQILGDLAVAISSGGRTGEIGFTFHPDHWGRGYASESVGALVDRLITPGVRRFTATIAPENLASIRVVERLGFDYEGRIVGSWFHGDEPSAEATDDLYFGMTDQARARWLARSTERPSTVELVEVDRSNYRRIEELATHYSQRNLVAPVPASFSDALFPPVVDGTPIRPWMRAIEADDGRGGEREPVGFVMLARTERPGPDAEPYLWRLLIDRWHQRRGIASMALDQIEDQLRADGHRAITVHWAGGPGSPAPFYRGRGYEPTGRVEDGETEGRKVLG